MVECPRAGENSKQASPTAFDKNAHFLLHECEICVVVNYSKLGEYPRDLLGRLNGSIFLSLTSCTMR